jgi:hypothetical protein
MKLNRFARVFVAVLFVLPVVVAAAAEDLTGKWSGKFVITMDEGEKRDDVAFAVLKHKGAEFGGTIGPNENQQWTISKAKLVDDAKEGLKVSFDVANPDGDAGVVMHFELKFEAGHLKGTAAAAADGHTMKAEVDLQRVK